MGRKPKSLITKDEVIEPKKTPIEKKEQVLYEDIKQKYPQKQCLTLNETAKELGVSRTYMQSCLKERKGIPPFRQVGAGFKRKHYLFSIRDIAKFIATTERVY